MFDDLIVFKTPHIFTYADYADNIYSYVYGFAIEVILLLLLNNIDGFLITEFPIEECFPHFSSHYARAVHFPVTTVHINVNVNKNLIKVKIFSVG
jgi:hypothetical protein